LFLCFSLDGVPAHNREDVYARLHIPNKQEYTEKMVIKSIQSRYRQQVPLVLGGSKTRVGLVLIKLVWER